MIINKIYETFTLFRDMGGLILVLFFFCALVSGVKSIDATTNCSSLSYNHPGRGNVSCESVCPPLKNNTKNIEFCKLNCPEFLKRCSYPTLSRLSPDSSTSPPFKETSTLPPHIPWQLVINGSSIHPLTSPVNKWAIALLVVSVIVVLVVSILGITLWRKCIDLKCRPRDHNTTKHEIGHLKAEEAEEGLHAQETRSIADENEYKKQLYNGY